MVFVVRGSDAQGRQLPLEDPLAKRLHDAAAGAAAPTTLVDRLLAVQEIFGADLIDEPMLRALLVEHVARLW